MSMRYADMVLATEAQRQQGSDWSNEASEHDELVGSTAGTMAQLLASHPNCSAVLSILNRLATAWMVQIVTVHRASNLPAMGAYSLYLWPAPTTPHTAHRPRHRCQWEERPVRAHKAAVRGRRSTGAVSTSQVLDALQFHALNRGLVCRTEGRLEHESRACKGARWTRSGRRI